MSIETTSSRAKSGEPGRQLETLLAILSSDRPWGDREVAAKQLGYSRSPDALPGLLAALGSDSFWMVRCAIVQALERIGDPQAIPTLREVASNDGFHVVREYAAKAIERLLADSQGSQMPHNPGDENA
jgi:HEAT repeat protein